MGLRCGAKCRWERERKKKKANHKEPIEEEEEEEEKKGETYQVTETFSL